MENNYESISFNSVLKFLNEAESNYKIKILYACETGSRAVGVNVEESDYDVKGFYIANESEYLRVIRSVNPQLIVHHLSLNIEGKEYDVDIELLDITYYFSEKILHNYNRADFWFFSKIIYVNLFSDEILNTIKNHLHPPMFMFSPRDKSGLETLEKMLRKKVQIMNKKLLCLLISCIQFLHTELFSPESKFPFYNIFEEISYIKERMENGIINKHLNEEEKQLLKINLELVEGLYNRKKQGRTGTTKAIPENLSKFIKMITEKFDPEGKRKNSIQLKYTLDESFAQSIFDKYIFIIEKDNTFS
jgi:hypothetical protein